LEKREGVMIHYRAGYKYQLTRDLMVETSIRPGRLVANAFCVLHLEGRLFIRAGYAWDGATDAWDTKTIIKASSTHDALYQFMREGLLPRTYKQAADIVFYQVFRASCDECVRLYREHCDNIHNTWVDRVLISVACRIYGAVLFVRCLYSFAAVQLFGSSSTDPAHDRMELTAP
jgi:hypothetical protein